MKVIIAGSRTINDFEPVEKALKKGKEVITEVVSGCAEGIDTLGEHWAWVHSKKVKKFPANWKKHGRKAGPIRNRKMAEYADAAVVIWDGKSRGSKNMIETMRSLGKPVFEVVYKDEK